MNRRSFITRSFAVAGGVAATSAIARLMASENEHMMFGPSITEPQAKLFSSEQRLLVAAISETILPATETPGAIDAGVPVFIENMVSGWLSAEERRVFLEGLQTVISLSTQKYKQSFLSLNESDKVAILEQLEKQAEDSPWYEFGNVMRDFVEGAPFICQIKELTIFGFFSSEIGAKEVLRHNPMPMTFDGEYALGKDDSTWSTIRLM